MINGKYTQTISAAREIDEEKIERLPGSTRHLKYTHGYGITLSRVDQVTSSGQPEVLIGNIPPESSAVAEIQITRPEIYFGELSNEYVIVGTDEKNSTIRQGTAMSILRTRTARDQAEPLEPPGICGKGRKPETSGIIQYRQQFEDNHKPECNGTGCRLSCLTFPMNQIRTW